MRRRLQALDDTEGDKGLAGILNRDVWQSVQEKAPF